jgi:hypothetical protein
MASRYQVPAKIEQIIHSGMNTQESLRLSGGFKASHTLLPNSRWLMRKLCPVIGILARIVNCLWHKFSMRNAIASQLVRHYLSRISLVIFQQPLEETLCSCTVTTGLEKHINYLSILVNSTPQVLLLTTYLYKNLVDVKCIAEPLMSFFQSFSILRAKFVAPWIL